jgi:hypothetical protein
MLIIVDKRIPKPAKLNLHKYGHLLEFETSGITYAAISGHPDIFFTQIENRLVVAANLPGHYLEILQKHHVDFETGQHGVEMTYPGSARYNAVATNELLVHNIAITDSRITEAAANKKIVHVHQGYTRCNLIFLSARHAVTSDKNIQRELSKTGIETLFFRPEGIELPGFDYGFFGGACGLWNKKLFLTGNPDHHPDGNKLRSFASNAGVEIISLCNRTLFDGGGIFFIRAM